MNKIMAKYDYAFGYVKGYFVLCGFLALGLIGFALWGLISQSIPLGGVFGLLIAGFIAVGIAVIVILHTRSKCPPDRRGIIGLALNMMLVGFVGAFASGWRSAMKIFGKFFGWAGSYSTNSNQKFSNQYYKDSDHSTCFLHSVLNDSHATIKDESGNLISVHFHGDSGLVCDDSGNLYYPL